jgi:phenylpropionate dioxygenase-like ring-hydroxylating dioxygenase large terminal subunit
MSAQPPCTYLRNVWYMAAWSTEVDEALLRRRIANDPILLFRAADGQAIALTDRCPHRFAPLSAGTREGDVLRCAYHGLAFGTDGRCVHNPFSDTIPKGAAVRAWPVHEQDGIVWLWRGEAKHVDVSLVPDFSALLGDGIEPVRGLMPMNAPFQFATDNLMDLSHIEFVHRGSFAGAGVIFAGKHEVRQDGATLHSNWWMPNVPAPGHTYGIYERGLPTDHWLEMRWNAPASMLLEIGAVRVGAPRESGVIIWQAHIVTPESDATAHYFWASTRASRVASEEGDARLFAMMSQAFEMEDKPIIEAAYDNLDGNDFWSARPLFLGIDAGGTRARRLLERMIVQEGAPGEAGRGGDLGSRAWRQ